MQHKRTISPFKKILPALVATLCMTAFTVFATLAFGVNALANRNVSATQSAAQPVQQVSADQATIQQLQDTIAQYQQRETQYKQELQKAADQINQTNQQNQQFRQLIMALQNAGVIQITQDGRVTLGRGG
jgi:chromosome segregation ATPase